MSVRPATSQHIGGGVATAAFVVVLLAIGIPFVSKLMTIGEPSTPATGALAVLNVALNLLVLVSFAVLVLYRPTWPRGIYFGLLAVLAAYALFGSPAEAPAKPMSDGTEIAGLVMAAAFFILPAAYMRFVTPKKYRVASA
ncbi:MAG TPA: hypothetical protein VJM46_01410 [Candidatus Saccharimonadales bacterium]|nr:hypothetical protein [Candidatus Saccharimonadales bacterium]